MSVEKRALRCALREQRKHLSPGVVAAAGVAVSRLACTLAAMRDATSVVGYIAHEHEIPITALLSGAAARGQALYLPRATGAAGLVCWRPGEPLAVGPGGVAEPTGAPSTPETPAVVLLPVVAWDDDGTRLGRGGGFYDRLLGEQFPSFLRIGLAYEFQRVQGLPHDPWDVPLHFVITEQRVVRCGQPLDDSKPQKGGEQVWKHTS